MAETPQRARWRKIWIDLLSSPALLDAKATDLWAFVTMILHAWWARGTDEGYVWSEIDEPMPRCTLARQARITTRQLATAITVLRKAKVIDLRGDLIVIPKFGRWQETADAARKRRVRALSGGHGPDSPPDKTEPKERGKGKGKEIPQPPPARATESPPDPDPRPPPGNGASGASSGHLHELDTYRRQLAAELQVSLPRWGGQGGEVLDGIGRALDELDGDLDRLRAVIRHAAEGVRDGTCKPVWFRRMWSGDGFGARLDAWREATGAATTGPPDTGDTSLEDLRRVLRGAS